MVPPSLREKLLVEAHNRFGHPGTKEMIALISPTYCWPNIIEDISTVLYVSEATDILSALWDSDVPVTRAFSGHTVSVTEENIIVQRLSRVPFTNRLKYDIWRKILTQHKVENFTPEEWSRFECLIPQLPISVLEKVNITDRSIMSYFGQVELSKNQQTKLAEDILSKKPDVFEDTEILLNMGNIVCGFNSDGIKSIKDPVLRSLIKEYFFQKIKSCGVEKLRDWLSTVEKHTVLGPPRTWNPEKVKQAGILVSGLTVSQIREIPEESFSQISPKVIESTPEEVLKSVKDSQLKTLDKPTLLSWRRKTQDLRPLYDSSGSLLEISFSFTAFAVILSNYFHFSFI